MDDLFSSSPAVAEPVDDTRGAAFMPKADEQQLAPVAKGDKHIWGIYLLLCLISVIELYSASSREVAASALGVYGPIVRHAAMLLAGFGIICYLQRTHYRKLIVWIPIFAVVSVVMMAYTMGFGEIVNGARRNFRLLGVSIYPSEFLKISSASLVALIMSRCQVKGGGATMKGVLWCAAIVLLYCGMLAPQGLTNTLLLISISISMMVIGGTSFKKLCVVGAVYLVCFSAYVGFTLVRDAAAPETTEQTTTVKKEKKESRVDTWVERLKNYASGKSTPKYEEPITSDNRQEMLGYIAQANGGVIGVFPGNSRETSRLPLAFTDYIYSIIVEEMGLVGGLFVLVLYLWLLARASAIASRCSRAFPALLVIGMALTIVIQALFHICIVTGVMPVSGQPLPLISKGGSSILVTSIAFGVMLSVSRFAVRTTAKKKDIKNEIEILPEEIRAENPTQL